jgi:phage gp36-like protein
MAVYTNLEELKKRLDPQVLAALADDVNNPPQMMHSTTIAVVERAIAVGAAIIDGYLLGIADLANPQTQAALERINSTLALYFLYRRRYLSDNQNPLAASRDMVLAHLEAIAAGRERIFDGEEFKPELIVFSTTQDSERIFGKDRLARF